MTRKGKVDIMEGGCYCLSGREATPQGVSACALGANIRFPASLPPKTTPILSAAAVVAVAVVEFISVWKHVMA